MGGMNRCLCLPPPPQAGRLPCRPWQLTAAWLLWQAEQVGWLPPASCRLSGRLAAGCVHSACAPALMGFFLGICAPLCLNSGLTTSCLYTGTIAFVGILGYIISFSLGAGAVTGLMVPEVNPERLRGERAPFADAIVALHAAVAPRPGCTCLSTKC